jgi:hypothetical protein
VDRQRIIYLGTEPDGMTRRNDISITIPIHFDGKGATLYNDSGCDGAHEAGRVIHFTNRAKICIG